MDDSLAALQAEVIAFRDARDWRRFHQAKDLVLGLVAEAGELAEVVLWREPAVLERLAEDEDLKSRLGEEMADVLVYLLYLAEHAGLDLAATTRAKLALNARKYPVERFRGSARKYDDEA